MTPEEKELSRRMTPWLKSVPGLVYQDGLVHLHDHGAAGILLAILRLSCGEDHGLTIYTQPSWWSVDLWPHGDESEREVRFAEEHLGVAVARALLSLNDELNEKDQGGQ